MILLDVNVLVHAHRTDSSRHGAYAAWLIEMAGGNEAFALTSAAVAGFVRVVTHPQVFVDPTEPDIALAFLRELSRSPRCRWLEAGERWWTIFTELCVASRARANVVPDAQLAALAVEHGCRLATADRGFARFPSLNWFDPVGP